MPATPPPPPTELDLFGIKAQIFWDGYRKGESLQHGPWRDILYLVSWPESDDFIDRLMGLVRPVGGKGGTIQRTPPHQYVGNTVIYCVEAEGNPLGVPKPDAKLYASDLCVVRAHYEVPQFDIAGFNNDVTPGTAVPWGEWEVTGEPTEYPLPVSSIVYEGGAGNVNPTKEFPFEVIDETMRLTVHQVPAMYLDMIRSLKGTLNDTPFEGWDRGLVHFKRYSLTRTIMADGTYTIKAALDFLARAVDWNMMPKDADAGPIGAAAWDFVKGKTSGNRPYGYGELNNLLNFFL